MEKVEKNKKKSEQKPDNSRGLTKYLGLLFFFLMGLAMIIACASTIQNGAFAGFISKPIWPAALFLAIGCAVVIAAIAFTIFFAISDRSIAEEEEKEELAKSKPGTAMDQTKMMEELNKMMQQKPAPGAAT